ncbi:MAG: hypothetical protein DMF59_19685 [Acidobacteria bacterium]|nr:MAG: hypothetical protein DMF59_19685 [Acidobacteriota bacterium]
MLQQTQMPVVLRYYKNFLDRFPTIADLAAATTDDVTAAWSGLGYYRRARMMRDGAIAVQDRFDGRLPDDVASLMTIPGIGRYTAGAIASIAYNRVAPIVDGNIARIIARLYGNDRNPWRRAEELVEGRADLPSEESGVRSLSAARRLPRVRAWAHRACASQTTGIESAATAVVHPARSAGTNSHAARSARNVCVAGSSRFSVVSSQRNISAYDHEPTNHVRSLYSGSSVASRELFMD